jgi:formylglycine-generating enzyme required for sulfatase activity
LRVFLSYHTPDRAVALGLKGAVEAALADADIFVDETHLHHGHLWQPALSEAIAKAQAFLILVSARVGDWQKLEYYEARDRKAKDDAFILLPVIIADRADGPAANLPGLAQLHWIESTEPSAPDPLAKILAALQSGDMANPVEAWRAINPYRGLIALEEQDADFFFGRDRETADILETIIAAPGRVIALVGNSGVGKSSLVQAGVIGSLKRQRWPGGQRAWPQTLKDSRAFAYLTMRPGEDPIDALMSEFTALWFPDPTDPMRVDRRRAWAERLRQGTARLGDVIKASDEHLHNALALTPPPRIFLYVDQGEELYARSPPAERKRFSEIIAEGLADSAQRLIVMTSLRADYYGELLANSTLFDLAEKVDVPPLRPDALVQVLSEPARVLGVALESQDLVSHVIKSAEDQPGALPLLADLFTDLWERMRERGDGTLRISDHREIIQVGAALSGRADQFLADNPGKVSAVKRLFTLRLAHVPRQGEPVRARWERDARPGTDPALDSDWALAEQLAGPDWRLTVTGERDGKATAEVAHEILLKTWPTLKRWLEDERDFLVWRGEIEARRKDYEAAGADGPHRQRQALLMGLQLDTAKKWLAARRGDIEPADQAFIGASVRAERASARNRRQAQAAIYALLVGIILVLVGVLNETFVRAQWNWLTVMRPYAVANFRPYVLTAAAERSLKTLAHFRECANGDCPEMIVIPAGSFVMGSSQAEQSRYASTQRGAAANDLQNYLPGALASEGPQHRVALPRPFAVSRFDVTFAEWDACVSVGGCRKNVDGGMGRGAKPAVSVSWNDAEQYVAWLSKMTGRPYRLLTEAEWEYAARAGTTTTYFWGDEIGTGNADCLGCGGKATDQTTPVGSFPANAFGLYDMAGEVWQWVEDCYSPSYDRTPTDGSASTRQDCGYRVVRGGAWNIGPDYARSAIRFRYPPNYQSLNRGFRVARTLNQ